MKLLISSVLCIFVGLPLAAQSIVFDVQALLNKYGYSVGVVDGVAGNKTKFALKKFYQDNTLEFDGNISDNELYDLNVYGRFNSNAYQPPKQLLNEIGGKLTNIGDLEFKGLADVISDKARNPVSVSNEYSKFGNSSLRFEVNNGECGFNDCFSGRDRERSEVVFKDELTKKERWYRIYIYLPSNQVSISPANNVLMQWKESEDDKMLLGVGHSDSGLIFNLNGDAFQDFRALILPNDQLLGKWTEILINTNWHPDRTKGFFKVWVNGTLKINYKGRATHAKYNKSVYLKFGTYAGHLQQYRDYFKTDLIPTRVAYFDGLMGGSSCNSIGKDDGACTKLLNQNVKEYKTVIGDVRLLTADRIFTLDAQTFEQLAYDLSIEDSDLDHNKLNHAIEAMHRKERQMAEEAAEIKKLEGSYEIASDLEGKCYFSINRLMIKEKRTEILASGTMNISSGRISFGPHKWKVGGSIADETFLSNQSNLVVDKDFLLHGTFPLFHLFIPSGSPSHEPLNVRFKIDERNNQRNSGDLIKRSWFDIDDGSNAMTGNFSFSCR